MYITLFLEGISMKKALLLSVLSLALTLSASASKRIVVNLSQQRACAYDGASTAFCGNISTGKPGHRTPTGRFHVMEKDVDHVSSKYPAPNGGAKMHYMLRVTGSGIAMHLGYVPNYPASHGCIRMQNGFAQRMYNWAHVGVPISIIGSPPGRVSRSAFSSSYGTARTTRTRGSMTPNDILAQYMGFKVRSHPSTRSTRKLKRRTLSKRRSSTRSKRRKRHGNPLDAIASR
jgi:hypothetical protein